MENMNSARATTRASSEHSVITITPHPSSDMAGPFPSSQVSTDQALHEAEARTVHPDQTPKPETLFPYRSLQNLRKITIILDYEEASEQSFEVDFQSLCSHSSYLENVFASAQKLRDHYAIARNLRRNIKKLLSRAVLQEQLDEKYIKRAFPLILQCHRRFPILEYQVRIKEAVEHWVDVYFKQKESYKHQPSYAEVKKHKYARDDVRTRLQYLTGRSIQNILEQLHNHLWRLKKKEKDLATKEGMKAAAQDTIFLNGYSAIAVESVLIWITHEDLCYRNVDDLFQTYELAELLGVQDLAATTLSKLSNAVTEAIHQAQATNITLLDILNGTYLPLPEESKQSQDDMRAVLLAIFKYVFVLKKPSGPLRTLLIQTVVDSGDIRLYEHLEEHLEIDLAKQMLRALFARNISKLMNENGHSDSQEGIMTQDGDSNDDHLIDGNPADAHVIDDNQADAKPDTGTLKHEAKVENGVELIHSVTAH